MAANLLSRLGITHPILQAPMAGISTPAMAAAVTNAGALGALGIGNVDAAGAKKQLEAFAALSKGPLNVNVFCHAPPHVDAARESAWIERFRATFEAFGGAAPPSLREIYQSFVVDDDVLALLLATRPRVVSLHFGAPAERTKALRDAGIVVLGSATNVSEARALVRAGVDAIVAQGWEAGGHRGVFDPNAVDEQLGTFALVRLLVREVDVPIIAAGGIMDGAGINAALDLGASAAQLGTAFVGCPESAADDAYRAALAGASTTTMTRNISGRPARSLVNRFTAIDAPADAIPDYPIAYDLGKSLHAVAKARGEFGFGAQWAGQAAALARTLPAAELVATLVREMAEATAR